jgi:hypothetical protein
MTDTRMGGMSSAVIEATNLGEGKFSLAIRLSDGRTIHSGGRVALPEAGDSSSLSSFSFDSDEFHKEAMRGNIDIRAVCAELQRVIDVAG